MRMELSTLPKGNTIIGRQTKRRKSNTFPQLMKGEKKHFLKRNKGFKVGHMQHFKSLELK
jgi:hypothetical protein